MVFPPVLIGLGAANAIYSLLNFQLIRGLGRLGKTNGKPLAEKPTVSVLIAARNEEQRIRKCLECLEAQDYPAAKLQIVVVDDRSEDGTASILAEYAARMPGRFRYLSLSETAPGFSPKKYALSQGLLIASGEIIVTTDADCIMSPAWVSALVEEFSSDTGLVSGLTTYYAAGTGTWEGVQSLEFFSYAVVAAALIGLRFPVNGNANNLAYRREVYDEVAGFASHGGIVSGDDDFLIQSIHRNGRWGIRYAIRPESQVQTEPPLSVGQFWEQRKRWASKCSLYQFKQTLFLSVIFSYYAVIPICIVAGLFQHRWLVPGIASWCVKTGTDWLVMRRASGIFDKRELMRWFLPTSLLHIPLIIAAVLAGSFGEFTWKGQKHRRKVKAAPVVDAKIAGRQASGVGR